MFGTKCECAGEVEQLRKEIAELRAELATFKAMMADDRVLSVEQAAAIDTAGEQIPLSAKVATLYAHSSFNAQVNVEQNREAERLRLIDERAKRDNESIVQHLDPDRNRPKVTFDEHGEKIIQYPDTVWR